MKPETLLACVQAFDKLIGTKYVIHLGRSGKYAIFTITIEKEDCHHLMGIHYLRDIVERSNRGKIFDRMMSDPGYLARLASSTQWTDELKNRVACTTVLEQILDDNKTIYRYNPKRLFFYSQIKAEYLLTQNNYQIAPDCSSDVYLFIDKRDAKSDASDRFCKSIFPKRAVSTTSPVSLSILPISFLFDLDCFFSGSQYGSLSYADVMPVYINALTVKGVKLKNKPIEFFESSQMKGLLSAPDTSRSIGRKNRMILVMFYDTGGRVQEILDLTIGSLHLGANVPYVTMHGKGDTFRNVPLMDKTVRHLTNYIKEFHKASHNDSPLFYACTHGVVHPLSPDSMENLIKDSAKKCVTNGINMPESCHCHMIRKTRAMDLYQAGMSLEHIQQLLGHKHISTTSGFYAFATLETLSEAMKKVDSNHDHAEKSWLDETILKELYTL